MPTDPVEANMLEGVEKTGNYVSTGNFQYIQGSDGQLTPCPDHLVENQENSAGDSNLS